MPVAKRADLLMRGSAHIGIIVLVDEAAGFQRDRAKDAQGRQLRLIYRAWLGPLPCKLRSRSLRCLSTMAGIVIFPAANAFFSGDPGAMK